MSNTIREYVAGLGWDEKILIMNSYEEYESKGSIGDSPIRFHTEAVIKLCYAPDSMTISWMQLVAFEVYRCFAHANPSVF